MIRNNLAKLTVIAGVLLVATGGAAYFWMQRTGAPELPNTATEAASLVSAFADLSGDGFLPPSPNWTLDLPADHGMHQESRTEAWQLSAYLRTIDDESLGFQLSVLRLGIEPPDSKLEGSVWDARGVFRAHSIFVDESEKAALGEERFARQMPELTGYDHATGELRVDDWVLEFGSDRISAVATIDGAVSVDLVMRPAKPALALEPDGAEAPFVGYAKTRLAVEGTVSRTGDPEPVTGTAWFDHTWGELPLPGAGPVATDRLQFQLDDGTDGMIARSRRTDGKGSTTVAGMLVDPSGKATGFDEGTVQMMSTRVWLHTASGTEYPVEWRVEGPDFDFWLTPTVDDQKHAFSFPIWIGDVVLNGTRGTRQVSGVGTLQVSGYTPP